MVVVIITGTPGSGKSTLLKQLIVSLNSKGNKGDDDRKILSRHYKALLKNNGPHYFHWKDYNVKELLQKNDVFDSYDNNDKCYDVDIKKMNEFLISKIDNDSKEFNILIDSHMSHYLPSNIVDLCIVCKCDISELKERLLARDYNSKKIRENLDCEILEVCKMESLDEKHNIIEFDTTKKNKQDYDIQYNKLLDKIKSLI